LAVKGKFEGRARAMAGQCRGRVGQGKASRALKNKE